MSISTSELKFYKAATVTDTTANGGRISANAYTSGVVQNVFPNILSAERTAGSTKYRKIFCKVANDADETFYAPQFYLFAPTAGDDWVVFFAGTQTNTQADITGSERIYGAGSLASLVAAGSSTLIINVESTTITGIIQAGDTLFITDKPTPTATTGNEETVVVNAISSVSGTQITLTTTTALTNGYAAGSTVSSVYSTGEDIECYVNNWVETGAFTYNESTYPVLCDNIGTIEQTWTITFTSSTVFTVSGNTVGSLASGNTTTNYAPSNPDFTKPYFTLVSTGWGGTPAAGNTLVFQTHPAAIPLWEKRVVPAGASSIAGNNVYLVWSGESL